MKHREGKPPPGVGGFDQLFGNDTVSFILTSFVTRPIFSCYTRHDQSIDVYARRNGDGWIYSATCVR